MEEHLDKLISDPELRDIFTRKEEYNPSLRDEYGRFPYYMSRERNIFEPRVSKYLVDNGLNMEYPDGKKFAVCLTHDIDASFYSKEDIIIDAGRHLLEGQWKDALKSPFYNVHMKWNPRWKFKEIMDLEEEYMAKSTFFIMGLGDGDQDFNYRAENLSQELGSIMDRGWEVGLHGGHEAYDNLEVLLREKSKLEKALGNEVVSYRNHFLRFRVPDTWEILREAGFKYDSTFGYADCIGFRNGMCHYYMPFNLNTGKYIDIYEIPLIIMDSSLFNSYMRLDIGKAWDITKQLIDVTSKYKGTVSINWHNTFFGKEYFQIYRKIVRYCAEMNGLLCSCKDIANSR